MKRNRPRNMKSGAANKKTKFTQPKNCKNEEPNLSIAGMDENILQHIYFFLVDGYKYYLHKRKPNEELKKSLNLLLNFKLSCKLFWNISKQKIFPLILNQIEVNLTSTQVLKIPLIKQEVEQDGGYKEKDINNIFYQTCNFGYCDMITPLLKYGTDINQGCYGIQYTPLMQATMNGNINTIKKLLSKKDLNVNKQTIYGLTALMSVFEREDITSSLLSRSDIDINMKDDYGKTALDYAKDEDYQKVICILQDYQSSS